MQRLANLFCFLLFFFCSGAQASVERIALVIGNSKYPYGGDLNNPINDAALMEVTLRELGFSVRRIDNATHLRMKEAIDTFLSGAENAKVALVYFAGHGLQFKNVSYLLPVDFAADTGAELATKAIASDEILSRLSLKQSRINIVILDACRNNRFRGPWRDESFSGLAASDAPPRGLLAYATQPNSVAADGEKNSNGLYTAQLVKHLKTKGLSLNEAFKRTAVSVVRLSQGAQRPHEDIRQLGEFSLNGSTAHFAKARSLAKQYSCTVCHQLDRKIIGPSYLQIADQYRGGLVGEVNLIANRIRFGSKGVWGTVPKKANNNVSELEAKLLAEWVLAGAP
jgi:uncharacterized caspase-like protein